MHGEEMAQEQPKGEPKHLQITNAIGRLRVAKNSAESLLIKITGSDSPETEKSAGNPEPSLVAVLNLSGNEIAEHAEQIISLIGQIRVELFG